MSSSGGITLLVDPDVGKDIAVIAAVLAVVRHDYRSFQPHRLSPRALMSRLKKITALAVRASVRPHPRRSPQNEEFDEYDENTRQELEQCQDRSRRLPPTRRQTVGASYFPPTENESGTVFRMPPAHENIVHLLRLLIMRYSCPHQDNRSPITGSGFCASLVSGNPIRGRTMTEISVIGLGAMGGALARAFQRGGHELTVWNRSPDKMKPFAASGAVGASDAVEAVDASPVILVCVHNYAAAHSIFGAEDIASHLPGRTLIQLSTGSPREVQESADWFNARDVTYLDGAALCLPPNVGGDDAQFLFAGPEIAFRAVEPLLECLGGDRRYVGENIRAAATLDLAWLSQRLGQIIGAVHGMRLCESEDVGLDAFERMFPDGDRVQILARVIREDDYANTVATVRVWDAVSKRFQEQARDTGINTEFPDFAASIIERTTAAGYGDEDVAALVKLLRSQ